MTAERNGGGLDVQPGSSRVGQQIGVVVVLIDIAREPVEARIKLLAKIDGEAAVDSWVGRSVGRQVHTGNHRLRDAGKVEIKNVLRQQSSGLRVGGGNE